MKYSLILLVLLCGCYSEKKAHNQFAKAAVAYPKIPAEYCANTFPVKDTILPGETISTFDTLYIEGENTRDTVMFQDFDTVRVFITKTLPAKIITNTIHIRDTIIRENTAKVKACEISNDILLGLLNKKTADYDGLKHRKDIWMWIAIGLMAIIGVRLFMKYKTGLLTKKQFL